MKADAINICRIASCFVLLKLDSGLHCCKLPEDSIWLIAACKYALTQCMNALNVTHCTQVTCQSTPFVTEHVSYLSFCYTSTQTLERFKSDRRHV
jgi:hypothetical protein